MSALLIQEEFVAYLPSLARVVGGIPEAVTLQAIWFKADKATGELVMSRADLAEYLGTSASSLGRYVKHLSGLGVLTYEGRGRAGYDKTTKFTVNPAALDALVQDAATPVTAPVPDAVTAPAESSGSQVENVHVAPTRMNGPESVKVTHSQSVNLTHSSTKNEEPNTSPAPSGRKTSSDGFREFWSEFPDGGYKGRREECRRIWTSMPIEDRHAAWDMLMAYKNSVLWVEQEKIPTPFQWLTNETWTGPKPRQVQKVQMFTADDFRLPD